MLRLIVIANSKYYTWMDDKHVWDLILFKRKDRLYA
jgi:hypothetical protein